MTFLRTQRQVSQIGVWGRSLGAVCALLYAERHPGICCLFVDSPFAELSTSFVTGKARGDCEEFFHYKYKGKPRQGEDSVASPGHPSELTAVLCLISAFVSGLSYCKVPHCVLKQLFPSSKDVAPINAVPNLRVPALFLHGRRDEVFSSHTVRLFEVYGESSGGKVPQKGLLVDFGGHNDHRSHPALCRVAAFFYQTLQRCAMSPSGFAVLEAMPAPLILPPDDDVRACSSSDEDDCGISSPERVRIPAISRCARLPRSSSALNSSWFCGQDAQQPGRAGEDASCSWGEMVRSLHRLGVSLQPAELCRCLLEVVSCVPAVCRRCRWCDKQMGLVMEHLSQSRRQGQLAARLASRLRGFRLPQDAEEWLNCCLQFQPDAVLVQENDRLDTRPYV